jgi:hypothetical protein
MNRLFRLLIPLLVAPLWLAAQSPAALRKKAEKLRDEGRLPEAAECFEQSARLRDNHAPTLLEAAETYYRIRDYAKAVECYALSGKALQRSELAGLRYARALKQRERYAEAIEAFKTYVKQYEGKRKAQIVAVVQNEIKGCELALLAGGNQQANGSVQPLPAGINSPANEFAPLPWMSVVLYFSGFEGEQVVLKRSLREAGQWQQAERAEGLPQSVSAHFGNGVFSADGARFYCTQCADAPASERGGNGLRTRCAIFVLQRNQDRWTEPLRLPDYLNAPEATTTHPCVATLGGEEWLFFASDRPGGLGGLDLYACRRPLDSPTFDFSLPQNLGMSINTGGDEATPFFNPATGNLWFSSNGHLSFGGMDIFKSKRSGGRWGHPENPGWPLNSPADELFFRKTPDGASAFFVSNRAIPGQKAHTRDEDIFEYFFEQKQP